MALIELNQVDLAYPIRTDIGLSLKEFVLRHLFHRDSPRRWTTVPALQQVSFRIDDGERVGIIGRNGAGKSTLLRTIAGIYPINGGDLRVCGSVCSLFDIAVGFEPDANGYENIYNRAYLQGLTYSQVKPRVQAISDFCELGEKFLNLPLRCYSTGMTMRLAFSVATSTEADILLIDEVFATGDLNFQKKAESRMGDLIHQAKIVVMVGHNLDFLAEFCSRLLWLNDGHIVADGPPRDIIRQYVAASNQQSQAA